MPLVDCNDPASQACLDELIKEINDELSIACQIPFTVPKKALVRMINRAKEYFYKIYEDSVEEMYLGLPGGTFAKSSFKKSISNGDEVLNQTDVENSRGIIKMPNTVWSVNNVFEIGGFQGEDGGFGQWSFSAGDPDFAIDKFIYSDAFGAGLGSENLMYYVINEKFLDNARQVLQAQISYTYNRLTHKFRFQGQLPDNAVIFQVFTTIPDCDLFKEEAFIRYCIAQAKIQLARIMGTFNYNLPGNITINYDLIMSEGQDELASIVEEIKGDEGVDYFFTG